IAVAAAGQSPAKGVRRRGTDAVGQSPKACATDGGGGMKKLASRWSFVVFTLAASQLMANCGMDAAQTSKPVMATSSGGGHMDAPVSSSTQPVVSGGAADYPSGATAMAATTDASQTNVAPTPGLASATEYKISQQDVLQISVFQVNDLNSAVQV